MSHSSFFQLEPRLLFDASVADATDHTMDDGGVAAEFPGLAYVQDDAQAHAYHDDQSGEQHIYDERAGLDASTAEIPRIDIFVIDASVKDVEAIEKALPADAIVIHLDAGSDGILTLSEALAQYDRVDALHILSHGSDGQISLGGTLLNEATLVERGAEIAAWSNAFTDTGDILIYGCDVAQTAKGEAFVQDLAELTGTDVAASINPTGAEDKGGDWVLETATGPIEASVLAAMGYDGLMEAPKPDASIAVSNTAPLIGTDVTLTLTFDNQSADEVGYGPYVDLFINHKGADGNTTDLTKSDGLNFKSATFFGTNVEHKLYTLTNDVPVGDQLQISDGKIIHPITGEEISVPDGFGVGDQLLVVTLPFGSFTPDQLASVDVTLTVDQKADPDIALKVASVGGFILGKDALHNPESDPPIRQTTVHELSITPQAFTVETFMDAPEGETVTGPNFVRHVDIVITPAPGTVMTGDTTVYFTLPDGVVLADGFVAPAGWEIVTLPVYDTDLTNDTLVLKLVDGQDITDPTTITVPVYVTEKYQTGADILNPATGEQATINFTNVEVKGGQWFGVADSTLDGDQDQLDVDVVESVTNLVVRSVQVIKEDIYKNDSSLGGGTVKPGDSLEYRLQVDISDFFRTGSVVVTDELPDGLTFDTDYTPTLTIHWQDAAGNAHSTVVDFDPANVEVLSADGTTWVPLTDFDSALETQNANGQTHFRFQLSKQLDSDNNSATLEQLVGGLVNTTDGSTQGNQNAWATDGSAGTGATTAVISFKAKVEEDYRTDDPLNTDAGITNKNLKERDVLDNKATVTVDILQRDDGDTVIHEGRTDDSTEAVSLPAGSVKLEIDSITRNGTVYSGIDLTNMTLAPGDLVTYKLTYDLPIGDFENLELDAYLPMPVFGLDAGSLSQDGDNGDIPDADRWNFHSDSTVNALTGVTVGDNNKITFTFGDSGPVTSTPGKAVVVFSAQVTDQPMADRLHLTAQGTHQDSSSQAAAGNTAAINQITLGQADVHVYKGYINKDHTQTGAVNTEFTPGSALTNANIAVIGASDATGFDANDKVTAIIALENQGSSARGAFNVEVKDALDPNLTPDASTLKFYKGDGTQITHVEIKDGSDWISTAVSGNEAAILAALQNGDGIRFIDSDNGALGRGKGDDGNAVADGSNIVYITYEATTKTTINPNTNSISNAQLIGFTNTENASVNFLSTPLEESANIAFRANAVNLIITATPDHADTTVPAEGSKTADAVVGEYIDYQITINLAEATTENGKITVNLGSGLGLVSVGGASGTGVGGISSNGQVGVTYAGFKSDGSSSIKGIDINAETGTIAGDLTVADDSFTVDLGNIINTDDDLGHETITLTFRAVALNTNVNVAGAAGAERQVTATFTDATSPATDRQATVTIREPQLTATLTANQTTVTADNEVEYTLTVTNTSGYAAHDVKIMETLNAIANQYLRDLTLTQAAEITGGTPGIITGAGIGADSIAYDIDYLGNGQIFTVKFKAQVEPGTPFGQQLKIDPTITWTSIPGDGSDRNAISNTTTDSERTGVADDTADDSAIGTGLNKYSQRPDAIVTFGKPDPQITIDSTSYPDGTGDPSDASVTTDDKGTASVSIGEVVRIRMVVELPESQSTGVKITPNLPEGLSYVGDAKVAFVSNDGVTSSIASLAGANVTGNDPSSVNLGDGQGVGIDLTSGAFDLGDLNNPDRDSDAEYIIIEFDARVDNIVGNQKGGTLNVNYEVTSGGTPATSGDVVLTIVEPEISIDKAVTNVTYADADPTTNSNATVTYTITITNNGNATANNVSLTDTLPAGATIVIVPSTTSPNTGIIDNSEGGAPNYSIDTLAVGESITVTYEVNIADRLDTPASTDAEVTWTSLPGDDANERTGAGGVNDYRNTDPAGFGTISGTVWDDTIFQNGAIDAGEEMLAGVTVTLTATSGPLNGQTLTTLTAADGSYSFGALPVGNYTITVPDEFNHNVAGVDQDILKPRWDSNGGTAAPVGSITVTGLTEGGTSTNRNFGYLQENDAPTVTFSDTTTERVFTEGVNTPSDQNVLGTSVALGTVTIFDTELERGLDNYDGTTLTIGRSDGGTGFDANPDDVLGFNSTVTISGSNIQIGGVTVATFTNADGQMVITFNGSADKDAVNTVASAITYANSSQNPTTPHGDSYNVPLRFRFNDANDNDKQGWGEALTGDATITVKVIAQNDPPVATPNINNVYEDDSNGAGSSTVTGNVKTDDDGNGIDSDPDNDMDDVPVTFVTATTAGGSATPVADNSGAGTVVPGKYGTLTIHPDGTYTYVLDNSNPDVNALNNGDKLQDVFDYTIKDPDGLTDSSTLTITINGHTDGDPSITPKDENGDPDPGSHTAGHNTVWEKGLVSPSDDSHIASGEINISAPDGLSKVKIGDKEFTVAELKALSVSSPSDPIDTGEGTLVITGISIPSTTDPNVPTSATVTYIYTLKTNQAHTTPPGVHLMDSIVLEVTDSSPTPKTATGTLDILIVDDVPEANPDKDTIIEDVTVPVEGNVLTGTNSSGVDNAAADYLGADGATVTGVTAGTVAADTHVSDNVNTSVAGTYGSIIIDADGAYSYALDNTKPAVQALYEGQEVTDVFTYTITDADGDQSTTTVTITITGTNDAPVIYEKELDDPENPRDPVAPGAPDTAADYAFVTENNIGGAGKFDGQITINDVDTDDTLTVTLGTPTTPGLESNGKEVVWTLSDGNKTLTATTVDGDPVMTIIIQNDGSYTVTLEGPIDHPDANGENLLGFEVPVTVTDNHDATAENVIFVTVQDSVPVAENDANQVPSGSHAPITGNVITGGSSGDVADNIGADKTTITEVSSDNTSNTATEDDATLTIQGEYGKLVDGHPNGARDGHLNGASVW